MTSRESIAALLLGIVMAGRLLGAPLAVHGQEVRQARIGLLTERLLSPPYIEALRQGLTEFGWAADGRSFRIEQRSAEGNLERLPGLAAELVASGVNVIVTGVGSPAALAAKRTTTTVPIVFVTGGDPVDFGIVPNRRKPGGNITGLGGGILVIQERLEMLRDMAPSTKRVAFLRNVSNPIHPRIFTAVEREGARLDLELQEIAVRSPGEFDAAFRTMQGKRFDALFVPGDALFSRECRALVGLAARFKMPAVYGDRLFPDCGGLMSFSVDLLELCRRAAGQVDRILRGARAGDLPVEEAVKFDVVINVATANSLGLKIPSSLRKRAELVQE
ncbi:MAG TPA: ABC transporter substrate-binding protein [Methylomirabilota bacterium]